MGMRPTNVSREHKLARIKVHEDLRSCEEPTIMFLQAILLLGALTPDTVNAEAEGLVRLRGGRVPLEGRVEVVYQGEWGTVRDGRWGVEDASVVCRQLGFPSAQAAPRGNYFELAPPSTPVHFNRVSCLGNESSLLGCDRRIVKEKNRSNHTADAGVICTADYSLQLVADSVPHVGRLDVWYGEEWRPLCAGRWGRKEATVACRQLGYEELVTFNSSVFPSNSTPSLVTMETNCSGDEFHLLSCYNPPATPTQQCATGMALGVQCRGSPSPPHRPHLDQSTCSTLSISWSQPYDRGSNITSYILRYKTHANLTLNWKYVHIGRFDPAGERTRVTLANLTSAEQYEVQVRAENGVGNSSYSNSLVAATLPAAVVPPVQLKSEHVGSSSATLLWRATSPCGTSIAGYEILYSDLGAPNATNHSTFVPQTQPLVSPTNVTFVLNNLRPFSHYEVRVRTVGHDNRGDNATMLVSSITEPINIETLAAAPSGAPLTVSVFLSYLHSSAQFQWGRVPQEEQNGPVTNYRLSCRSSTNSRLQIQENFNSSVFQFELANLEPGTKYECSVSASTAAGRGPESTPVKFTTPTDLNVRPRPPSNIVFEVRGQPDASSPLISAQWRVSRCAGDFNCSETLGYVVTCRAESTREELRKTVWQSEVEDVIVAMTTVTAAPYTRYSCSMAAFNSYGFGFAGSIITLETPESAPSQPPTQLYTSDLQPTSTQLHWTYSEVPPTGRLLGFKIRLYYQDTYYPERNSRFSHEEMYELPTSSSTSRPVTDFSYSLMYLSPGVGYNVYVSAQTIAGEGPQARVTVTTLRTAPGYAPTNFQVEIVSYEEPYTYSFTWKLPPSSSQSLIHTGFLLQCYPNTSRDVENLNTSHAVFIPSAQSEYSTIFPLPGSCAMEINMFACNVVAFNERGKGPQSEEIEIRLPCPVGPSADSIFAGTFLSQPYYSLAFLSTLILLIILILIAMVTLCICSRCAGDTRQRRSRRRKPFNPYSSAADDSHDENYISMAPSAAIRVKSHWTDRSLSCATGTSVLATSNFGDPSDTYNPYDEIPGDRPENLYDEIHPRSQVISTIIQDNFQSSADTTRPPTLSGVMVSGVDGSGIELAQQPDATDINEPTPFTSPRTSSYVPDGEHHTIPSVQIPTTSSQISLQTDYVEIFSSSTTRKMVQSGRDNASIAGTSTSLAQEQSHIQLDTPLPLGCNSEETRPTNQDETTAGSVPSGAQISHSNVRAANSIPSQASHYDSLAVHEDCGHFSDCTDADSVALTTPV